MDKLRQPPQPVDSRSRDRDDRVILDLMTKTPYEPIINTQAALHNAWRHLMGPWGNDSHSVWMMLIVDDRPLRQLTEITEAEEPPDAEFTESIAELLRMLTRDVAPGARFAFLRSRPGPDLITDADRAWASTLYAAARLAGVQCEVVHLATRGAIRPIPQDDVGVIARPA